MLTRVPDAYGPRLKQADTGKQLHPFGSPVSLQKSLQASLSLHQYSCCTPGECSGNPSPSEPASNLGTTQAARKRSCSLCYLDRLLDWTNTSYSTNLITSVESCEFCGVKKGNSFKTQNAMRRITSRKHVHEQPDTSSKNCLIICSSQALSTWEKHGRHSAVEGKLDFIISN